jgi:hypothetical protein
MAISFTEGSVSEEGSDWETATNLRTEQSFDVTTEDDLEKVEKEKEKLPKTKLGQLRRKVFIFFDNPNSSKPVSYIFRNITCTYLLKAFVVSIIVILAVVTSTLTFLIGSLPQYWSSNNAGL